MKRCLLALSLLAWPFAVRGQQESPPEPVPEENLGTRPAEEPSGDAPVEDPFVLPPLPKWENEDSRLLREGELVPGEELLSETLGDLQLPPPPPVPVPPPEVITPEAGEQGPLSFPEVIGEEFVEEYFGQRPATFLLDPQELLSRQEFRDRESFLQYHAGDSEVDLYVYLFDARQDLPDGVDIDGVFDQHFQASGPTALVFYYLGMPERAQLSLSSDIKQVVSLDEQQRALRNAIQEAFEKSDPAYQLDNFAVELSIRLYWFEKAMAGTDIPPEVAVTPKEPLEAPVAPAGPGKERVLSWVKNLVLAVTGCLVAGGLGFLGRWIAERRLRYTFPEVDSSPLLGAPHAAGVGAVVSFGSAQLPPAQQRDQVPDYLQKM